GPATIQDSEPAWNVREVIAINSSEPVCSTARKPAGNVDGSPFNHRTTGADSPLAPFGRPVRCSKQQGEALVPAVPDSQDVIDDAVDHLRREICERTSGSQVHRVNPDLLRPHPGGLTSRDSSPLRGDDRGVPLRILQIPPFDIQMNRGVLEQMTEGLWRQRGSRDDLIPSLRVRVVHRSLRPCAGPLCQAREATRVVPDVRDEHPARPPGQQGWCIEVVIAEFLQHSGEVRGPTTGEEQLGVRGVGGVVSRPVALTGSKRLRFRAQPPHLSHDASSTTLLRNVPMPSIVMLTMSPCARYSRGVRAWPTPPGVPVTITSPGRSVVIVEMYWTRAPGECTRS